jgi:hypothetical protein
MSNHFLSSKVPNKAVLKDGAFTQIFGKLILATGRQLDDLSQVFSEIELFDCVVAENGALLYFPATKEEQLLGDRPTESFINKLRSLEVEPLSVVKFQCGFLKAIAIPFVLKLYLRVWNDIAMLYGRKLLLASMMLIILALGWTIIFIDINSTARAATLDDSNVLVSLDTTVNTKMFDSEMSDRRTKRRSHPTTIRYQFVWSN